MLRQPLASKRPSQRRISRPGTKLAPIHGWNARDPWAGVPEGESIVLDNWFPRESWVETRQGHLSYVTGFTGNTRTLMAYSSTASGQKLFCTTDSGIFDVTTAGVVGSAVATISNGFMQYVNFQNSAGWFLHACNGSDDVQLYDGTSWKALNATSSPALTFAGGAVSSQMINVNVFKNRLFFIPTNRLSFFYLGVGAIAGSAAEFPLQGIFSKGGTLVAMGTWTLDGGSGVDDLAVFVTSEGQFAVFQGTDPSSATAWNLVGVYNLAKPIGQRPFCKFGGDLLVVLEDGLYPLSKAFQSSSIDRTISITDTIINAWISAVAQNRNTKGWSCIQYSTAPFILVNVPIGGNAANSVQFVMNTQTNAWTRFTGMGGQDFAVLGSNLYMCRGSAVYKAWTGFSDDTANIVALSKSGYDHFGYPGNNKQWKLIRPNIQVVSSVASLVGLAVDFRDEFLTGQLPPVPPSGGIWDTSLWDASTWGADFQINQSWATAAAWVGHYAATMLQVTSNREQCRWMTTDHIFEVGEFL